MDYPWQVRVAFYKPSGKWYADGQVAIHANPWDSNEKILASLWANQKILEASTLLRNCWTIVLDNLPASDADPNYHACWKMVLQVGKET